MAREFNFKVFNHRGNGGIYRALLLVFMLVAINGCGSGGSDVQEVTQPAEPTPTPTPTPTVPDTPTDSSTCVLPAESIETQTTSNDVAFVRTPDACFTGLAGYDFQENYVEIEGLRMHYLDEGPADGEVVLMLHGQPSWSYLYRKMIPVLTNAGYRVIAPDHIGMGKSDKPVDVTIHQFEQHVAWLKTFIATLSLTDINLFVQDWGSLMGLRIAGDSPELFSRIVLANGDLVVLPEGMNPFVVPSFEINDAFGDAASFFSNRSDDQVEGFQQWIDYAAGAPDLNAGDILQLATTISLSDEEVEAYRAPYPSIEYKAAIRAFPSMIAGISIQNFKAWNYLGAFNNPFLALAGEFDTRLGSEATQNRWIAHVPGADGNDHRRFQAGHFIQDDVGEDLALHVLDFMQSTEATDRLVSGGDLYNFRYCEILLVYLDESLQPFAEVWGTQSLNSACPQALWDELDFNGIASDNGALAAIENGPRFVIVDASTGIGNDVFDPNGEVRDFGGIGMQQLTTVRFGGSVMNDAQSYIPAQVDRSNIWQFVEGRRVYELTDPNGTKYIMQSYNRIADSGLQTDDLRTLGSRLQLPEGWSFESRVLEEALQVSPVDGIATVLTDDLRNTYQLVP